MMILMKENQDMFLRMLLYISHQTVVQRCTANDIVIEEYTKKEYEVIFQYIFRVFFNEC